MTEFFGPKQAGVLDDSVNASDLDIDSLNEVERDALQRRVGALQKLLETGQLATYKIEVVFGHKKTNRGAFPGALVVFNSGSAMSGGGDDLLYPCPDTRCNGYISHEYLAPQSKTAYCKVCKRVWKQSDLKELRMFILTPDKWASVLAREVIRACCLADVFMKTSQIDIRDAARTEMFGHRGGEEMYAARDSRGYVMYTFASIIKDVNAGGSLEARLKSMITA